MARILTSPEALTSKVVKAIRPEKGKTDPEVAEVAVEVVVVTDQKVAIAHGLKVVKVAAEEVAVVNTEAEEKDAHHDVNIKKAVKAR